MLIEEFLKSLTPSRSVSEEEVLADPFLAMLRAEVSLTRYRRLEMKRRWGQPAPTREEEQNCLLVGAVASRAMKGYTPF